MTEVTYGAFLSYRGSEPDVSLARSLHTRIEAYRLPASLRGEGRSTRIRAFLDTFDINASSTVRGELLRNLQASRFLVVLCTPRTPESSYIAFEIRSFQKWAPHRVITVLLEGTPEESIPAALLDVDREDRDALFIDLRKGVRTERKEFLALMALLCGCNYNDLVDRHAKRLRLRIGLAAVVTLSLVSGGIAYDRSMRTVVEAAEDKEQLVKGIQQARDLMRFADSPPPAAPSAVAALDEWLGAVAALLERRPALRSPVATSDLAGAAAADAARRSVLVAELLPLLEVLESHVGAIEKRRLWAATVEKATLDHPQAGATWDEVRASLATANGTKVNAAYRGCRIDLGEEAISGLVPIGIHPRSKLWEFYDLRSAWGGVLPPDRVRVPRYREGSDRLDITSDMGIVFVLLPGGEFVMGAELSEGETYHDPWAQLDEQPLHSVTLAPFLIAKFELTRGQWRQLGGEPKEGADDTLPCNNVSWVDADRLLRQHHLSMPTEAQWEYACRAGVRSPWSTGATPESLVGSANLKALGLPERLMPVGRFEGNLFGVHDMHGNVAEWCRDRYCDYEEVGTRPGDGLREGPVDQVIRVFRGGMYYQAEIATSRSAYRFNLLNSEAMDRGLGVRPVRNLQR